MATLTQAVQVSSIATSLIAAGGIAALSLFDIPELASQPANRALPQIRWLFSRGSHFFPQAAALSSAGFAYLAYTAFPPGGTRDLSSVLAAAKGSKASAYALAALLSIAIAPVTTLIMLGNNFALIAKNEALGGSRSEFSAAQKAQQGVQPGDYSAEESVGSKSTKDELTDLSGPAENTTRSSSAADDAEVKRRLETFGRQNMVRAALIGAGGIVGLLAALA